MKRVVFAVLVGGMLGATLGCGGLVTEDVGTSRHAEECGPLLDGAYPMMSSLAITAGWELERWEATTDLYYDWTTDRVKLTQTALDHCMDLGYPRCDNMTATLAMQEAGIVEVNGQRLFDSVQYRQQLKVYLERQHIAESRPCGQGDAAWCAEHELRLDHKTLGPCSEYFWYELNVTSCSGSECDPNKIVTKLIFAGWPENGYLSPSVDLDGPVPMVGIDPAVFTMVQGMTPPMSGSCLATAVIYDPAGEYLGDCCEVLGEIGTLEVASWNANTLVCEID